MLFGSCRMMTAIFPDGGNKEGVYPEEWYCQCRQRFLEPPAFLNNIGDVGE